MTCICVRYMVILRNKLRLTEIGEHSRPMGTLTPWTTIPSRPSSVEMPGALDVVVASQHWIEPVEHSCADAPVAAATMAREKMASLANIVKGE